ncbi:MAG: LCP family protein [Clostridium sp.]|nr:LCP family protein [Clostridium sp.]
MNELKDKDEQYNAYLYKHKHSQAKGGFGKLIMSLLLTIVVLAAAAFAYIGLAGKENKYSKMLMSFVKDLSPREQKGFNLPILQQRQNILIVGVDSNGDNADKFKGTRSDTMILVNLDPAAHSINAISIPRDSKVYLAGDYGVQKINAAHALGGIDLTIKTVEDTLGIKVNKYVLVNNDGVKKLVDALGGVPVYIEKDMYYNDNAGKLHINLSKGLHVLNGDQVEGYLRFRKDGLGDIGRTSRQQWFVKAVLEKLQSPSAIPKIPEVLNIASTYVKTNLSLYEMSHIAAALRNINMNDVEFATLPGSPSKKGYISYWILDPEKTQEVIDRMVYRDKPAPSDKKLVAGIMYAFDKEEEAMRIKDALTASGYEVNCIGRAHLPHSQIIGHNAAVTSDFISWLKKQVPEVKGSQFVYDPVRMYCVHSDFTIIVSGS